MLTRSNYNEWALLMRVNLQAHGLWHALESEEGETIEYREDRLAFARHITICVPLLDKEGRLLLTEEEWLARLKLRDDTDESNGPSSRKGGKKPWKSRWRMHRKEADQKKEESTDDGPIQCS